MSKQNSATRRAADVIADGAILQRENRQEIVADLLRDDRERVRMERAILACAKRQQWRADFDPELMRLAHSLSRRKP